MNVDKLDCDTHWVTAGGKQEAPPQPSLLEAQCCDLMQPAQPLGHKLPVTKSH